jgi:hypothetical protein
MNRQTSANVKLMSPLKHNSTPALRFSPTAWAKLLILRDAGETEVGGFGISAEDDLLYVEDIQLVRQVCDVASVAFDDTAVADFFDDQADVGIVPARCGRIWVHTHPGTSPQPSLVDEETFARAFGLTDWAVMFVLARGGATYARLRFHVGPGGDIALPVYVDWTKPFAGSDHSTWLAEYQANVAFTEVLPLGPPEKATDVQLWDEDWFLDWERPADEQRLTEMEDRRYGL